MKMKQRNNKIDAAGFKLNHKEVNIRKRKNNLKIDTKNNRKEGRSCIRLYLSSFLKRFLIFKVYGVFDDKNMIRLS